jgi:hypothetical protein
MEASNEHTIMYYDANQKQFVTVHVVSEEEHEQANDESALNTNDNMNRSAHHAFA